MIIYFADRSLEIKGQASTSLHGGLRISEDVLTEEIESGVNTFSFKLGLGDENRAEISEIIRPGMFVLRSDFRMESNSSDNAYNSLYQIIDTEYDTSTQEMSVYAEDAGLELINKVCPAIKLEDKNLNQMLRSFIPSDWDINLIACPSGTKTYTWDGENTATERVNSVAGVFDCEVFYSFVIDRFEVTKKVVNVTPKRGNDEAASQLRLNRDINRIVSKTSIANLATALSVTGGTPEGKKKPINLKEFSYNYTDTATGEKYSVDTATGQMRNTSAMARWASSIDPDGLIVKSFSYETTNQATLAGKARAELQKISQESMEYEVEFVNLPESTQVGDRVNIIDENGELYLEARLLKIESSVCADTQTAIIGDYVLKDSGISAELSAGLKELLREASAARLNATTMSIVSSGGNIFHNTPIDTTLLVTVFYGDMVITTQEELVSVFGESAKIIWQNSDGGDIAEGFSYRVTSGASRADFMALLDDGDEEGEEEEAEV